MGKKRNLTHFTESEVLLLLKCAREEKRVLEDKTSDGATWRKKEEAWARISDNFNRLNTLQRPTENLLNKYKLIKKTLKCKIMQQELIDIEYDGYRKVSLTPAEEEMQSILAAAKEEIESEFCADFSDYSLDQQTLSNVPPNVPVNCSEWNGPDEADECNDAGDWSYYVPTMADTPISAPTQTLLPEQTPQTPEKPAKKFKRDAASTKIANYTDERGSFLLLQRKFMEEEHKLKMENLQLQNENMRLQNELLRIELEETEKRQANAFEATIMQCNVKEEVTEDIRRI